MNIADILVIIAIAAILGLIIMYIRREKKKGVQCIGCPDANTCASKGCGGNCAGCSGSCGKHN